MGIEQTATVGNEMHCLLPAKGENTTLPAKMHLKLKRIGSRFLCSGLPISNLIPAVLREQPEGPRVVDPESGARYRSGPAVFSAWVMMRELRY